MKIAVTTPTGNIGKVVTDELLKAGADVTLIARHPEKVQAFVDRGATVVQGSQDDKEFVIQATRGMDALFWLIPPDYASTDLRGFQNRIGEAGAAAIQANAIPRVVFLSSVGAHIPSGTGPVTGLYDVERLLEGVATHITHLRPSYFFENFLMQLEPIKSMGKIFLPVSGATRLAMIGTTDIGKATARRILDTTWTGKSVLGLLGPADLSFDEAAAAIGRGIGREVTHIQVSEDQARQAIRAMGLSEHVTEVFLELERSIESGLLRPAESRTSETTTPTTLEEFARDVIRPMIGEPVSK